MVSVLVPEKLGKYKFIKAFALSSEPLCGKEKFCMISYTEVLLNWSLSKEAALSFHEI